MSLQFQLGEALAGCRDLSESMVLHVQKACKRSHTACKELAQGLEEAEKETKKLLQVELAEEEDRARLAHNSDDYVTGSPF